ncbi:MAG: rhomboid family intramembrane serine protease [Gemmatimonadaceae bacterium]
MIANVVLFFLQMTLPATTGWLLFVPTEVFTHPWTLVTYMFIHQPKSFGHIFFNMIGLYFFGPRVEDRMGSNQFITLYLISGVFGALLSLVLAPRSPILGASGAVLGVLLAFARFWPRQQLMIWGIIPIEARWLVLIYAALDLFGGFGGQRSGVANFAHLGGFAGAFLYLLFLEKRKGATRFKKQATPKIADPALSNWRRVDTSSIHSVNKDEVDRILDKINASGIGSLTPQERQFLSNFVPPDDRKPT